jgi:hypothetical protein
VLSHYGDCGLKRRIPTNGTLGTLGRWFPVTRCAPYTLKPGGDKALDHRRACCVPEDHFLQWESSRVVGLVQVNRTSSPCPAPQEGCTP